MNTLADLTARLHALGNPKNAAFAASLVPTLPPETILGAYTAPLRTLARELRKTQPALAAQFLAALPHHYLEEKQLHAFLLSLEPDFDTALTQVDTFLDYVDNWMTCDQLSPLAFKNAPDHLAPHLARWLTSEHPYRVRFAIVMHIAHFLGSRFRAEHLSALAHVTPAVAEHYYVRMAQAWYYATALDRQTDTTLAFLKQHTLPVWVHNKTLQKARESRRIPMKLKTYLCTLRRTIDK